MKHSIQTYLKTSLISGIFAISSAAFAQTPPPLPVKTLTIEKTNVPLSYSYPARVQSASQVEIHARVSGLLLEKHYQDGEAVKAGDLLYTIDPKPYQAIVNRAKAQVLMEQAKLRQAEREKKRVEGLYSEKAVSEQERDQATSAYELAQAGLVGAQAALQEAQLNLDYTQVTAPTQGLTGQKRHSVGDLVGRDYGATHLTNITQLDPIEVHFAIVEKEFVERETQIQQGQLRYQNGSSPSVSVSHLGETFEGQLDYRGHEVEAATGSVKLRARFDNPNKTLLPGAFVHVELAGIEAVNVIQIPQKAVLQIGTQSFVYVVKDNKAEMRPVGLKTQVGNTWLITQGLEPGDQLITNNLVKLRPNAPVAIQSDDADKAAQ
ncbi:efflux RND transporter periplasmic adaptor subunit [Thiomicrospira sp.]|uniref:efflux RND transporter periplasmic adaptor subunit n=1 Tax=Thiomicrospira sp. TaxID=935 RepID=UPI002F9419BF